MKGQLLFALSVVLNVGLFGCSTTKQQTDWPFFCDAEKGPTHVSLPRNPQTLDYFTNGIPQLNWDTVVPSDKIASVEIKKLSDLGGMQILEARLTCSNDYFTDAQMILQEIMPDKYLPVYVQVYNRGGRRPSELKVSERHSRLIIETGMDYSGTGHFHNRYRITVSANHVPTIVELAP